MALLLLPPAAARAQVPCLSGFVVDPGGNPVVEGDLDFDNAETGVRLTTPGDNTDEFGFYRVCVVPGTYIVSYAPPPRSHLLGKRFPDVRLIAGQSIEKNVTLDRGVAISGKITNEDGEPVGDVDFDADLIATGERVYTPNDNSDTLTGEYWAVVPTGLYRLRYQPLPGSRLVGLEFDSVRVNGDTTINLTLEAGFLLGGQITDAFGTPLPGTGIDLRDWFNGSRVYLPHNGSDETGAYQVAAPAGTYEMRIVPPFGSRYVGVAIDSLVIDSDLNQDITLQSGYLLTLIVTDSAGNLISDVDLDLIDEDNGRRLFTPYDKSDSSGVILTSVLPDVYTLRLDANDNTLFDRLELQGFTIEGDTTIHLTLPESQKVNLQARVMDSSGIGIEGIELSLRRSPSGAKVSIVNDLSDADGRFNADVPRGTFQVRFSPPPGSRYVAEQFPEVTIDGDTSLGDIVLAEGYVVSISVTDDEGSPLAEVDLDIVSQTTDATIFTPYDLTDVQGHAVLVVPPDEYILTLTPPAGSPFKAAAIQDFAVFSDTTAQFMLSGNSSGTLPEEFRLHQNFPNPFNENTIISYVLLRPSTVELTIYNILGKRVTRFDMGPQSSGSYTVSWDGTDHRGEKTASGVYFYQLRTANGSSVRKMILLR